MSGPAAHEQQRTNEGMARVRLASGPLFGPVLARVVSMVLARADWPLDRIDNAMLVCDALCAHAPAHANNRHTTFSVQADEQEAELRVLDLVEHGAERLVKDATLPGVGNLLELITERISVERGEQGQGSQLVLVLSSSS